MDWNSGKLLIMDKSQRLECRTLRVDQGPRLTTPDTCNALSKCGVRSTIRLRISVSG